MSRFYGGVRGNRGEATRCGHNEYRAYAQSHDIGVSVEFAANADGEEWGTLVLTSGRSRRTGNITIGRFEGTTFKLNPNLAQLVEQFNKENSDD